MWLMFVSRLSRLISNSNMLVSVILGNELRDAPRHDLVREVRLIVQVDNVGSQINNDDVMLVVENLVEADTVTSLLIPLVANNLTDQNTGSVGNVTHCNARQCSPQSIGIVCKQLMRCPVLVDEDGVVVVNLDAEVGTVTH
jgi:hypothetical protein